MRTLALATLVALIAGVPAGLAQAGLVVTVEDGDLVLAPGESRHLRVFVANPGPAATSVDLKAIAPAGFGVEVVPSSGTIPAGATRAFTLRVTAPRVHEPTGPATIAIEARRAGADEILAGAALEATVVALIPSLSRDEIGLSAVENYPFDVRFHNPSAHAIEATLTLLATSDLPADAWAARSDAHARTVRVEPGGTFETRIAVELAREAPRQGRIDVVLGARPVSSLPSPPDGPLFGEARFVVNVYTREGPERDSPAYAWPGGPTPPERDWNAFSIDATAPLLPAPGGRAPFRLQIHNPGWFPQSGMVEARPRDAGWSVEPSRFSFAFNGSGAAVFSGNVTGPPSVGAKTVIDFVARDALTGRELARWWSGARVSENDPALVVGANQWRERADLPYGSYDVAFFVGNAGDARALVDLSAVALGEGRLATRVDPPLLLLEPGDHRTATLTITTDGRPPARFQGFDALVLVARDRATGVESVADRQYFWPSDPARIHEDRAGDGALSWIVSAVVAFVAALLALVAAARSEAARWALLAPFAGLYTRLARDDVTGHKLRAALLEAIKATPGVTFTELRARFRAASGTLVHHLRTLERHRLVTSRRDGALRRFFVAGTSPAVLAATTPSPAQGRILAMLAEGPLSQREIAERLGITKQGANHHVKTLARRGLIAVREDGRWTVAVPADSPAARPGDGMP
ncbi:MAG TPA: MarR family transcriptional regulator [Candidatus Thermoplasmatota archaeon]|nr:MarR family transcriptional regulator [Candidatus Thermoplasmatota archaeon]